MVLKIYGVPNSIAVRRVAVVCKEKNIPYEIVTVDIFKGEHKAADYVAKHPFGQVPYINDDGFELFESRAIARYLAAKYASQGTPLIPTDPKANALFEQAASIELCNFDPLAAAICWEKVFKKIVLGLGPDDARVQEYATILNSKLDAYEVILSKQKYLAGDEITLADLFHLPHGKFIIELGFDGLEKKPNVSRWWKDISSRPSWQAVKDNA